MIASLSRYRPPRCSDPPISISEVIERPAPGRRLIMPVLGHKLIQGAPKGNRNAFKHSRYSAEANARRARGRGAHSRYARSGLRYRGGELRQRKADPCEAARLISIARDYRPLRI
jgi:hypothetical protein